MAWAIIDGRFLLEIPERTLAAGRQSKVPVIVGANDRDIGLGTARSKEELFAVFGPDAARARELYDPRGNQTLEALIIQVYMDNTMTEPTRHLANELARGGQPVWLYRFAYVNQAVRGQIMGTLLATLRSGRRPDHAFHPQRRDRWNRPAQGEARSVGTGLCSRPLIRAQSCGPGIRGVRGAGCLQ